MTDTATLRTAISTGGLAFSAAGLLAPRALVSSYGAEATPEISHVIRLWAAANAALAVGGFTQDEDKRFFQTALATNAAGVVSALLATGAPARARVTSVVTSGAFAVAAAVGLSQS